MRIKLHFQPGPEMTGTIMRHLSPRTFTRFVNSLPLQGATKREGPMILGLVNIDAPFDKTKEDFQAGELAYDPRSRALCVFAENGGMLKMVPLGKIDDPSLLRYVRDGAWLLVGRIQ